MNSKMDIKFSVLFCLVLSGLTTLSIGNLFNFAQGQSQVMPFEIGDNISQQNATSSNLNGLDTGKVSDNLPCSLPRCPPGQACIQSCP
jgi:hypothetical protein